MKPTKSKLATVIPVALLALLSTLNSQLSTLFAQGTAFTYQGRLNDGSNPANGNYDLTFTPFNVSSGPGQVGGTITDIGIGVSNGLFTVVLDFGPKFTGADRWLEIAVRTNGSVAAYSVLSPRQALTPTPYAIFAETAGQVSSNSVTAANIVVPLQLSGNLVQAGILSGTNSNTGGYGVAGVNTGSGVGGGVGVAGQGKIGVSGQGNIGVSGFSSSVSGTGVSGSSTSGDGVFGTSGKNGVHGQSSSASDSGVWGENIANGVGVAGSTGSGVGVSGSSSTGDAVYGDSGSGRGVAGYSVSADGVYGESGINGVHGVSRSGSDSGVWGQNVSSGVGVAGNSAGGKGVYGVTSGAGPNIAGVWGENSASNGTAVVCKAFGSASTGIYAFGTTWAGYFDGNVRVCTLTISGGCDLAEPFQMSVKEIPKGSVVVIDDENAGKLKMSDRSYDHRVAGIVSGANGITPGISLSQQGVLESGQNVALSGRVYVLADASSGPIKPGDLLTTSNTPGHAMKVTEHAKAQGAIIGKAMSALKEGKGMVLVLVTLQ